MELSPSVGTGPLSSLAVSPLTLSPSFSPSIHDYTVRCAAGDNVLGLDMTAAPGGSVRVTTPMTSDPAESQQLSVTVGEDQAVVVQASAPNAAAEEYWIRCLPHDFPNLTVTSLSATGQPPAGWYLIGNATLSTSAGAFAMVLDTNGTPVYYKRSATAVVDVDALNPNSISYTQFGLPFEIHHLDSGQVESIDAVGVPIDPHELEYLPNGDRLILAAPQRSGVDLTGLLGFAQVTTITDCVVQELSATGELVWQWQASEHIDPAKESTYPLMQTINGQSVADVYHCNSIQADDNGDLLISARHTDALYFVAKATGMVTWKLGGAAYNKDGARLLSIAGDPQIGFYRQHDARFLQNGHVTLFDDQTDKPGPARGVEYALDFSSNSATVVRQWLGTESSRAMGSFRLFSDGTAVIGWGIPNSGGSKVFTDFDVAGNPLRELAFDSGNLSYRAIKRPVATFDIDLLRHSAGTP